MILNFIAFIGLGIFADSQRLYFLSVFCYVTPFIGKYGMLTATLAGLMFFISGQTIAGCISIGLIIFQLVLHKYWN